MRIDKFLSEKFGSRTKAADAVTKRLVTVNGKRVSPSYDIKEGDKLVFLKAEESFVSNGGYKLSKAIKDFGFSADGKIFADIGASNGGFTDCLFQNGAKKVYCIDVGESQLDKSLLDKNVVIYDNFNARNLTRDLFEEDLDGIVIDVSFISLTYILEAAAGAISDGKEIIALIKPQFECESKSFAKRGIVKSAEIHKKVIYKIYNFALSCNLMAVDITDAPKVEGKNREYLIRLVKNGKTQLDFNQILNRISL